ncbi:transglycosylase family protein [Pseudonocardia nematodicida]|uniref:Transglycosylase family protein n=1 Tax=Pseudonocardia nematodicida TaxID=1206997 RepID=A0ABV1KFL9_9PSEU
MAGRHRRQATAHRHLVGVGAVTALAAAPLATVGTATASESSSSPTAPSVERTSTWDELAHCESTGNWQADTGNGFKGGLQFQPSTWEEFGGLEYASSAELASKHEQIDIAQNVQEGQGWKAWPACTENLGWR